MRQHRHMLLLLLLQKDQARAGRQRQTAVSGKHLRQPKTTIPPGCRSEVLEWAYIHVQNGEHKRARMMRARMTTDYMMAIG